MDGVRMRHVFFGPLVLTAFLAGCSDGATHLPASSGIGGDAGAGSTTTTTDGGTGGTSSTTAGLGSAPACDGECHLWKSALFDDLSLFWIGPGEPPPCQLNAPTPGVRLHANPQPSPITCPSCSCAPSGCELPDKMHASAAKCPAVGAASINWDAPGWTGDCTSEGGIAQGLLCAGVPCVQSITIEAPAVTPCAPVAAGNEVKPEPAWGLTAQECILGPLSGEGCGGSEACVPKPIEGFSLCLYRWGEDLSEEQCPAEYPRFLRMFADSDDTRACEPCTCGDPQGTECSALVSVFTDSACGTLLGSYTVTSATPTSCHDLPSGVGLGSKEGTLPLNKPGSCQPNGGPVGDVAPTMPLALCCQPDMVPAP